MEKAECPPCLETHNFKNQTRLTRVQQAVLALFVCLFYSKLYLILARHQNTCPEPDSNHIKDIERVEALILETELRLKHLGAEEVRLT